MGNTRFKYQIVDRMDIEYRSKHWICSTLKAKSIRPIGQKIPVTPGGILYASTSLYWENISSPSGNAYFGYTFYDASGDEITHANMGINLNSQPANATTPVLCSGKVRVPSGASFVHIGIRHYQISGDIWIGKTNAFVQ